MPLFSYYAVQKAVYDVLSADATLMATVSGIFDFVPQDTDYPYVTIGNSRLMDYSTVITTSFRQTLTIQVYSRSRGRKEVSDIMAQVHGLLHDTTPAADDHSIVDLRYVGGDITQNRDGLSYSGNMQFDVLVEID